MPQGLEPSLVMMSHCKTNSLMYQTLDGTLIWRLKVDLCCMETAVVNYRWFTSREQDIAFLRIGACIQYHCVHNTGKEMLH